MKNVPAYSQVSPDLQRQRFPGPGGESTEAELVELTLEQLEEVGGGATIVMLE